MRVYLVRHGKAENDASDDASRRLTKKGRQAVERVAESLRDSGVKVPRIEHSQRARARETAEILVEHIGGELHQVADIDATDPVEPVARRIGSESEDLMLVGHSPFMYRLASYLLTGDPALDLLDFHTASIACLERSHGYGWMLEWFISPEIA